MYVDEHKQLLKFMLVLFEKKVENVAGLVGDSCSVNKAI